VQLVADVEAQRADGRQVADAGPDSVVQVVELDRAVREDVADVGEERAADRREDRESVFEIGDEDRAAAERRDDRRRIAVLVERMQEREVGAVRVRRAEIAEEVELIGAVR
jgi:hypothetical protein